MILTPRFVEMSGFWAFLLSLQKGIRNPTNCVGGIRDGRVLMRTPPARVSREVDGKRTPSNKSQLNYNRRQLEASGSH